jgi:hypothetical protein
MPMDVIIRHVPLEALHHSFGHRCSNTILFASEHIAIMAPESFCDPCNIIITRKNVKNNFTSTDPQIASHTIYMDMLPTFPHLGINPLTTFQCFLIMVDRTSRKPHNGGFRDYTSNSIMTAINPFNHHQYQNDQE